jgi:hypothetical protein
MTSLQALIIMALTAVSFGPATAFLAPRQQQQQQQVAKVFLRQASESNNIERIEYKIYPDGRVEQKVMGVKGSDCVKLTESINQALGEVITSEPTEEMFEQKVELDQTLINTQNIGSGDSWEGASSW